MEKALCKGIVITVTLPAHALPESVLVQNVSKVTTGILNPSV